MGKRTLFHPVSLYVIRAAAEWHGFKFGHIRQIESDPDAGTARYRAEVVEFPADWLDVTYSKQREMLDMCFTTDINVKKITTGVKGGWFAELSVKMGTLL